MKILRSIKNRIHKIAEAMSKLFSLTILMDNIMGFLKKHILSLCVFLIGTVFISSSFLSCSEFAQGPSVGDNTQATNNSNDEDDDDDDDDDDEDDGDECRGIETCRDVCEHIYSDFDEQRDCMEEGEDKVAKLEKVHNLLMGRNAGTDKEVERSPSQLANDLEKISDGDNDIDSDEFSDYLEIGFEKWKEAIRRKLAKSSGSSITDPNKIKLLKNTIKWLGDEKDDDHKIAEILKEKDSNSEILEALLRTLYNDLSACSSSTRMNSVILVTTGLQDSTNNKDIWKLHITPTPQVEFRITPTPTSGKVKLKTTDDARLYDALSCRMDDITSSDINIFEYAEDKRNQPMFDMAFKLLKNICNKKDSRPEYRQACARALLCWSAWKNDGTNPHNSDIWDWAEEHKDALGGSDYDDCKISDFNELIN